MSKNNKTHTDKRSRYPGSSLTSAGNIETTLDQEEVMKAMMAAARKGKGRASDEDLESEEEGSSSGGSDSDVDQDNEDDGSEEETLDRERSRPAKGSGNIDVESDSEAGPSSPRQSPPPAPTRTPLSRVNISRASSAVPPTKSLTSPFSSEPRPAPSTTFESLGLSAPLISALASINITRPTEIQSACVKAIMSGRDCIGGAKTGSGKTLAFALPIVERIARDPFGVWAVVLTPTRELAYQLTEQFLAVGRPLGLTTITIVGGMDSIQQAKELDARPHIIVATPGRLCDLLRSDGYQSGKLGRVRTLVLDEADRLLTPTFAPELSYLFSQIPPTRQTCLFTATVSEAIMDLANKPPGPGKQKPFVYRVESETLTVGKLKQKYLFIPSQIRDPYLVYLLRNPPSDIDSALRAAPLKAQKAKQLKHQRKRRRTPTPESDDDTPSIPSTIIFTQRCATAHLLHLLLTNLEIPSVPLHSHLTQPQRLLSLARFRAREVPVLVTTDVGSRGLDIPSVAMVINWDCPRRSDDYVHRVGRTARAGRGGVAVTVVTERDVDLVQRIEEDIGVKMAEMELPEEEVLEALNAVSMARRMATMEMHDSGFGERQATNKAKAIKRAKRDAAAQTV